MQTQYKGIKVEGCGRDKKSTWYLYSDLCKGCGLCVTKCPLKCLNWSKEVGIYSTPAVEPDKEKCTACGICETLCPDSAIRIDKGK